MPKGYWIPQIDVANPDGYQAYLAATPPAHQKYHGIALVRGGRAEVAEGRMRSRIVLREFPSYTAALDCYRSEEYQRARPLRLANAACDFVIVEGYDGPQPAPVGSQPAPTAMKGYWIALLDVHDAEAYKRYIAANALAFGMFGARFLVRAGQTEVPEGKARGRIVVIEFPSFDAAAACHRSAEYQAAKRLRDGVSTTDLVIVEGHDA